MIEYTKPQLKGPFNTLKEKISKLNIYTGLILVFSLLIFLRDPQLFLNPRFWAEEGAIYFSSALKNGFSSLLLSHLGYYSLVPNISSYLATLIPLLYAPFVPLIFSFALTITPMLIVLYSNSSFWENSNTKKIIGIGIILFINDAGGIWLNTINSQFYLCLTTFLLLLEDNQISKVKSIIYYFILFISFLTGVVSCFLAPFFLIKFLIRKNKFNLISLILSFGLSFIQGLMIFFEYFASKGIEQPKRFYFDSELINILVSKNYLGGFFISKIAHQLFILVDKITFLPVLIFVLATLAVVNLSKTLDFQKKIIFIGSYYVISLLSFICSFEYYSIAKDINGIRYAFVPNIIINLMIMDFIWKKFRVNSKKYAIISILIIFLYTPFVLKYFIHYRSKDYNWKKQVELLKNNKINQIEIPPGGFYLRVK